MTLLHDSLDSILTLKIQVFVKTLNDLQLTLPVWTPRHQEQFLLLARLCGSLALVSVLKIEQTISEKNYKIFNSHIHVFLSHESDTRDTGTSQRVASCRPAGLMANERRVCHELTNESSGDTHPL